MNFICGVERLDIYLATTSDISGRATISGKDCSKRTENDVHIISAWRGCSLHTFIDIVQLLTPMPISIFENEVEVRRSPKGIVAQQGSMKTIFTAFSTSSFRCPISWRRSMRFVRANDDRVRSRFIPKAGLCYVVDPRQRGIEKTERTLSHG